MYNYNYDYNYGAVANSAVGSMVWTILAAIIAIVGGILVYVLFLNPKKEVKTTKFLSWLKDFLSFKTILIEKILNILYLISTIFVVLISFNSIGTSFLSFILTLVLGPILIRLVYEGILMMIMIWKNTSDINKKLK